jgi:DNA-binding NarL/FixJ family response regulator
VGVRLAARDPQQAEDALARIRRASTDALGELRGVPDLLRAHDAAEPRDPTPALADLDRLVSDAAGNGMDVRVEVRGDRHPLPAVIEVAAYRIVQESLTNVVRHARSPTATVTLTYVDTAFEVEVLDQGHGVSGADKPGGHGITGIGTGRGGRGSARSRPWTAGRFSRVGAAPDGRSGMIRVVVADDQALVRVGCRTLLEAEADIEVVGEADTGSAALDVVRATCPEVVLMDIRMPDLDGLEATRRITADPGLAGVRVLILTTFEIDEYVFDALRAGASGFLLKDADPEDLVRAVRVVAGGEALLSPTVTRRMIAEFVARPERRAASPASLAELTEREREVLSVIASGLSNDEIAETLVISPATVRTHINRVMMKLAARDRAQLVVMAYEAGLVAPGRHG